MIRRRIPPQYDVDPSDIVAELRKVGVAFRVKGRVITIEGNLTGQQISDLRAAILPLLQEITDVTA